MSGVKRKESPTEQENVPPSPAKQPKLVLPPPPILLPAPVLVTSKHESKEQEPALPPNLFQNARLLGSGAQGRVYLAYSVSNKQPVVVKVFAATRCSDAKHEADVLLYLQQ